MKSVDTQCLNSNQMEQVNATKKLLPISDCVRRIFLAHAAEVQAEVIYKIPGGFGWKKSLPLQLIFDKAVAEDLGLSEEVTQKLKSLHEQLLRK